jgi:hypothetical protein
MNPRRLLPYLLVFLVLAGVYAGLRWRQEQQVTRQEMAKKVFHLKETDLSSLSLIRGAGEVRLVKKDQQWYLTAPLATKADQTIVDSVVSTLARLRKERDLGVEKDLQPYGMVKPGLVVKFTAQGQPHRLAIGAKVPGGDSYYALKDQDPHLFMITRGSKDTLDRQLLALRDKTLLTFISSEAQGLKIKNGKTTVNLEKTGPQTWVWTGRPDFKVRGDRVEKLLRDIHLARIKNFLEQPPKNDRAVGLVPKSRMEVTVVTPAGNRSLFLGAQQGDAVYARVGLDGPVVLVDAALPREITRTLASLEDRRLWSGAIVDVHQVAWGPPGQTWTARKEKDVWKITGPEQAATQMPAVRLEMALYDFQKLEGTPLKGRRPPAGGSPAFVLELFNQVGKPLFHLEEVGTVGKGTLKVLARTGDHTVTALVPRMPFRQWQAEMQRLTATAQKPGPAPAKQESSKGGKP